MLTNFLFTSIAEWFTRSPRTLEVPGSNLTETKQIFVHFSFSLNPSHLNSHIKLADIVTALVNQFKNLKILRIWLRTTAADFCSKLIFAPPSLQKNLQALAHEIKNCKRPETVLK